MSGLRAFHGDFAAQLFLMVLFFSQNCDQFCPSSKELLLLKTLDCSLPISRKAPSARLRAVSGLPALWSSEWFPGAALGTLHPDDVSRCLRLRESLTSLCACL